MDEKDVDRLRHAAATLAEYFDSVQIFVTRHAEDGKSTGHLEYGAGNNYAIFGQVWSWVQRCIATFRTEQLMEEAGEEETDTEELV